MKGDIQMSYDKNEHSTVEPIENEDNEFEFNKAMSFVTEELRAHIVHTYEVQLKKNGKSEREFLDTDQWIQRLFLAHEIRLNDQKQVIIGVLNNRVMDLSDFILHVVHYANIGGGHVRQFSGEKIEIIIDRIMDEYSYRLKQKTIKKIIFRNEAAILGIEQLKRMLQASTGIIDPLDLVVVQHWIWLTKRKMLGLKVGHHVMLVFYGAQGGGKSELLTRLLQPIVGLYRPGDFLQVSDERCYRMFKDPVIFIDEMAGAERACINRIKNLITSPTVTGRPLYGNRMEEIRNNATWIGGSNFPLDEIIKDDSGNRRFYQIDCLPKGQWDRDSINEIDYLSIWQSVDENGQSPLESAGLVEAMHERQQSWRFKSSVEEYVIENHLIPDPAQQETFFVPLSEIVAHYTFWCRGMGRRPSFSTLDNLGRQLSRRLKGDRQTVNGKQVRGYLLARPLSEDRETFHRGYGDGGY
jgi:hypothetical protein